MPTLNTQSITATLSTRFEGKCALNATRRRRRCPHRTILSRVSLTFIHSFIFNLFFSFNSILNKITPEKFDKLSRELLDVGLESQDVLKRVLLLIFNKALDDPKYSFMYAKLCKVIYDNLHTVDRLYEEENTSSREVSSNAIHSIAVFIPL